MRTPRRLCLHTTNAVQRALLWAFALVFAVQSVAYATMVTMPNAVGSGSVTQFVRTAQAADRASVHAHVHHDVGFADSQVQGGGAQTTESLVSVRDASHVSDASHGDHGLDHKSCKVCLTFTSVMGVDVLMWGQRAHAPTAAIGLALPFATFPYLGGLMRPPNVSKA
jgi:hypothetical protein